MVTLLIMWISGSLNLVLIFAVRNAVVKNSRLQKTCNHYLMELGLAQSLSNRESLSKDLLQQKSEDLERQLRNWEQQAKEWQIKFSQFMEDRERLRLIIETHGLEWELGG
jgi:hypothetical protein